MAGSVAMLKAIQNLGNKYAHVRAQAVESIAQVLIHPTEDDTPEEIRLVIPCLARHVGDPDEKTATKACSCLILAGPAAVVAIPELAHACLDKRQAVGMEAANALIKLVKINKASHKKAVEILPILVEGLMEMQPDVVVPVAAIIRSVEADAEPAIEQLVEEYLVPEPTGTVEKIREKITGYFHKRRQRCFELLGKIGPVAAPAVPALKEFVKSEDPWLQQQAKATIIRIRRTTEG